MAVLWAGLGILCEWTPDDTTIEQTRNIYQTPTLIHATSKKLLKALGGDLKAAYEILGVIYKSITNTGKQPEQILTTINGQPSNGNDRIVPARSQRNDAPPNARYITRVVADTDHLALKINNVGGFHDDSVAKCNQYMAAAWHTAAQQPSGVLLDNDLVVCLTVFLLETDPAYQSAAAQAPLFRPADEPTNAVRSLPNDKAIPQAGLLPRTAPPTIPEVELDGPPVRPHGGAVEVNILSPRPGAVVKAGELVEMTVQIPPTATLASLAFVNDGYIVDVVTSTGAVQYTANITIPLQSVGTQTLGAVGVSAYDIITDLVYYVGSVDVTVDPGLLFGVELAGLPLLERIGQVEPLRVLGLFADNLTRDLTSPALGTTYQSLNPAVVEVSAGGLMQARSRGSAVILATVRHPVTGKAAVASLQVRVNVPPEVDNAIPVAVVGPNQTVGTEQIVFLDASASSDTDGDPLTYRWRQTGGRVVILLNDGTYGPQFVIVLNVDANGDGFFEGQIAPTGDASLPESGPDAISAVQVAERDGFGRLLAVLFDEEISAAASQQGKTPEEIVNFGVDENQVLGTVLQPSSQVVYMRLRDGIGPFILRSLTVANIDDRHANPMTPVTVTLPITITVTRIGGVVDGQALHADKTTAPNAAIQLWQKVLSGEKVQYVLVTAKAADAEGRFHFDYVASYPTIFKSTDPESGERAELSTQIRYNGQRLDLRLIFQGKGTVAGYVFAADGVTPPPGADVGLSSISSGQNFVTQSDASGGFVFGAVPVGNANLTVVHQPTRSQAQGVANVATDGGTTLIDLILLNNDRVQAEMGSVSGRVYRSDGVTPAEGAPVYSSVGGYTLTDSSGYYQLTGLPPGGADVESFDQSQFETASVRTTIVAGQDVTANLILFGGTGTIEGQVLDSAGQPVEGATIGGGLQLATSDADGHFVLADMPLGQRSIQARVTEGELIVQSTVHLVRAGETVIVTLRLPAVGRIVGRVLQADGVTPAANQEIIAVGPKLLGGKTDANGFYLIPYAVEGSYLISAFKSDFKDGNARTVRVSAHNQTVNGDIRWQGKGSLRVTILDDDGVTPLGAQMGLSELAVLKNVIADDGNPQCYQDVKIGDTVVHFTPCQTLGVGYMTKQLNRIVDNDPSSGSYLFENVFCGAGGGGGGQRFQRRRGGPGRSRFGRDDAYYPFLAFDQFDERHCLSARRGDAGGRGRRRVFQFQDDARRGRDHRREWAVSDYADFRGRFQCHRAGWDQRTDRTQRRRR